MTDPPDTHPPPSHAPTTPIQGDTEAVPGTPAEANESGNPVNVTIRVRRTRHRGRDVPPLPTDSTVITPPRQTPKRKEEGSDTFLAPPSPHRPTPQIRIETRQAWAKNSKASAKDANAKTAPLPEVTMAPGTRAERSDAHGTRGGAHQAPPAQDGLPPRADSGLLQIKPQGKNATRYAELEHAAEEAHTFDALAETFAEMIATMELYKAAPTKQCFSLLECIQGRLTNHHTFPREDESHESFSTVLSRSVVSPVSSLTAQIEAQQRRHRRPTPQLPRVPHGSTRGYQKANPDPDPPIPYPTDPRVQTRTGSPRVADIPAVPRKNRGSVGPTAQGGNGFGRVSAEAAEYPRTLGSKPANGPDTRAEPYSCLYPTPEAQATPLPNPSDERILIRFHGNIPPILSLPYPEILSSINACLAGLKLPVLVYTQKHSESGIFVVPATKEDLRVLSDKWDSWAPLVLPGGSIAPVATHCFLQVDGIPFAGAGTLDELRREFEERNPQLGRVVGTPTRLALVRSSFGYPHSLPLGAAAARASLMLRLVQSNTWKSRNPLDILMGVHDFNILCLQEPWEKEVDSFEYGGYFHITPNCDARHRVSMYFKQATIPGSSICPRPDLSTSPDILVVDFISKNRKITITNLYNDCETRAGVGLLAEVLAKLGRCAEIFLVLNSNSHHILWDSKTLTCVRPEDFDLHDLLIAHPLTLAPPLMSPHTSLPAMPSTSGLPRRRSDHLPITYELDPELSEVECSRYNPESMDVDKFIAILRHELGLPIPSILTQEELDDVVELLCTALIVAFEGSTEKRRPSCHSRRWWTLELTALLVDMKRACRIAAAKQATWHVFIRDLDRVSVYDVLGRLRGRRNSVFPSLVDPMTKEAVVEHEARGRLLGKGWFGTSAVEVVEVEGRSRNEKGRKGVKDTGGAAVRVEDGKEREQLMEPLGNGQVCDGEMAGLVCSTTKALRDECTCILCAADSQAALGGILSTKPRSGQFRAIRYDQLVRDAMLWYPHLTIVNMWTSAHIGTVGNELADDAAKIHPSSFPSFHSWDPRWKITKTGAVLCAVNKSPPSLIPSPLYSSSSILRKTSSNISQLRTGFTFLNADRAKSGFVDSAACDACGDPFETRAHFLLECQSWEPARQSLYADYEIERA
ncbi:hypothetical protein DFH09DRAFT_1368626 [Mycena vulgaris]|nr:hypothetical protein DFH09DRAFT_1368626 [Mycena vulgaris]